MTGSTVALATTPSTGGDGNDTYVLSAAADIINADASSDTVQAAIHLLDRWPHDLENLTLTGALAVNATGNNGATPHGNTAANVLNGGGDNDTWTATLATTYSTAAWAPTRAAGLATTLTSSTTTATPPSNPCPCRRWHRPGQVLRGLRLGANSRT